MAIRPFSEWCASCQTTDTPLGPEAINYVLQGLCEIISGGGGGGGSGVVVTENCLIVTADGTGFSIGEIITEYVFFNTAVDPPVETARLWYNVTTGIYVTGITSANTEPCPGVDLGDSCLNPMFVTECADQPGDSCENALFTKTCVDNESGTLTSSTVTGADTIIAGFQTVSVMNVGTLTAGVVDGQPLLPGETFNISGYWSPASNTYRLTPEIEIDGTGTTFRVRTFA